MDGKSHKMFAPIFTLGATVMLNRLGVINHTGDLAAITLIATVSSMATSMSADADLHAHKPLYVIWDTRPKQRKGRTYHVKMKSGAVKQYAVPRSKHIRVWATVFKKLGVTKHRDWRTHSPSVWIPLAYLFYKLSVMMVAVLPLPGLQMILPSVMAGLGLGYISHIVADAPNKGGIPYFFSNKQISITKKMFGNYLSNFFKSGNKVFTYLFMAVGVDLVLLILVPDMAKQLNSLLFGASRVILKGLWEVFMTILLTVFGGVKSLIGR